MFLPYLSHSYPFLVSTFPGCCIFLPELPVFLAFSLPIPISLPAGFSSVLMSHLTPLLCANVKMGEAFFSYRTNEIVHPALSLRPTEPLEGWCSYPFLHAWQDAVLYLFHTWWIDPLLILGSEKSGLVLSSSYLCPGTQLSFFIFCFSSILFYSYTSIAKTGSCEKTSL